MSPFSRLVRWPKEIHHKGWSLTVFFNEKDIGSLFSFPSDGEAKTRSGFSEFDLSFEAVFLLPFFHPFLDNQVSACDAQKSTSFFSLA